MAWNRPKLDVPGRVRRVDRAGEEDDIGRKAGPRVVGSGDPGVDAAEVGPERVTADKRLEVVVGIARNERPHDVEPVGELRQVGGTSRRRLRPGRLVATSPVALRMPSGRSIFGSNVSNWLGPPCRNRKMTDLPVNSPGRRLDLGPEPGGWRFVRT